MPDTDYIKEAQALLDDPNVTEEEKAALRSELGIGSPEPQATPRGEVEIGDISVLKNQPEMVEESVSQEDMQANQPSFLSFDPNAPQPITQLPSTKRAAAPMSEDYSYSALMQEQDAASREAEMDAADLRPNDPNVRNATKRLSLFTSPEVNAGSVNVFRHTEPSVAEVMDWAIKTGNKTAYEALAENGVDSEEYKEYADIKWNKVAEAFGNTGEGAIRVEYLDPDSATDWYSKATGIIDPMASSFVGGYDDALSLGVGKQLLSTAYGKAQFKAEDALVKAGILQPLAKRMEYAQQDNPALSIAGNVLGFMNPAGITSKLAKAGETALKYTPTLLKWAVPAIEGGLALGGEKLVEKGGAATRGEKQPTWDDVVRETASGAFWGGLFGQAADWLGGFAGRQYEKFRDPTTQRGRDVTRLEAGGGKTELPFMGERGISPPKEIAQKGRELAKENIAAKAKGEMPEVISPHQKMAGEKAQEVMDVAMAKRAEAEEIMGAENKAYYALTENEYISSAPVGELLQEIYDSVAPGGKTLPFFSKARNKLGETIEKLTEEVPNPKLNQEFLERFVAKHGMPNGPIEMQALYNEARKATPNVKRWRKLNPENVDKILGGLNVAIDAEKNKMKSGRAPEEFGRVQRAIYELRSKFPENEAVRGVKEIKNIDGKNYEVSGWPALKERHSKTIIDNMNTVEAIGLKGLDKLNANIAEQKKSFVRAMLEFGQEGNQINDAYIKKLLKDRPDLVKWARTIVGGETFERMSRGSQAHGVTARSTENVASPALWATMRLGPMSGAYIDPLYGGLKGLSGKGGPVGMLVAQRKDDIATAGERAMDQTFKAGNATFRGMEALFDYISRHPEETGEQR